MSKTALTHLFGSICAVICLIMSIFTLNEGRAIIDEFINRPDYFIASPFAHPTFLIFGGMGIGTFCLAAWAFEDKIFEAAGSSVFHPLWRLVGKTPPDRKQRDRVMFFDLNGWQMGTLLAVLLFVFGFLWYQVHEFANARNPQAEDTVEAHEHSDAASSQESAE